MFGLRPTPRRARWLATVTAHAAARQEGTAVAEPARRRLASVTDGALLSHRAGRESSPRIPRLRAALPTLAQRAQDAAAQVTRLEAMVPPGAVEEAPSWVLRLLLVAALIAEAFLVFGSLGATSLSETPIALFCSSLAAAPIAAALLSRAGSTVRRAVVWRRRWEASDAALVLLALGVAIVLGVGLTLSRVADVQEGRTAALLTSAGLQAVILTLPLIDGYLHASPVPGLPKARRLRDRTIRQYDAAVAELRRLEAAHAQREVELVANAEATHAEFERTFVRLGGSALAPRATTGCSAAYPPLIGGHR
ncbi:MAG: hypothetical protein O9271_02200 [Gemmatimonas sp.]|nr:hypothetical protein [Gemmatimonas sp.]